jgi:hypothetical protein
MKLAVRNTGDGDLRMVQAQARGFSHKNWLRIWERGQVKVVSLEALRAS